MSEADGGTVFTVGFACDNCGQEWSIEYQEKVRVYRWNEKTILTNDPRVKYDPNIAPIKYAIFCPNCKLYDDVKIVDRIPIEERSTID